MRGSGTPIWDDLASPDDLAALAPPAPRQMPSSVDVLVVGGGVIGLATAAACVDRGMSALVVERDQCAGGASGRAAGILAPDWHPEQGERWHANARRSLQLHADLDARWKTGLRLPDLRVLRQGVFKEQGHVDPVRFCAALARHAGTILIGTTADAIDVAFKTVVYATGAAPLEAGIAGQSWVKGHLIATEPTDRVLKEMVMSPLDGVLALQLPSGRIVAGGTKEPGTTDAKVDPSVVAHIATSLMRICGDAPPVTHTWTCFRPLIDGEAPVITRDANVFVAAGFYSSGILMAPVAADIIATAIEKNSEPAPIA